MVAESATTPTSTKEKKPRKEKKPKETTTDPVPNDKETIIEKPKKKKRKHAEKPAEEVVELEAIEVDNMESAPVDTDKKLSKKERKKAKKQETVEMEVDEVDTGESAVVEAEKKLSKNEKAKQQVSEQVKEPEVSAEEPKEGGEEKRRKKRKKGTVAAEPEEESVKEDGPPKKKRKNKTGLTDPDDDKTLTNQARKALLYAFEQFRRPDKWKFQKARQNWLVRNIWSAEAIPEAYEPLLVKYLSETKGGVRENLIKSCRTILESPPATQEPVPAPKQVDPPKEGAKPAMGGALVVPVVEKAPDPIKQARAKLILQALESFVDPETR